jgi:hypothetical protein
LLNVGVVVAVLVVPPQVQLNVVVAVAVEHILKKLYPMILPRLVFHIQLVAAVVVEVRQDVAALEETLHGPPMLLLQKLVAVDVLMNLVRAGHAQEAVEMHLLE